MTGSRLRGLLLRRPVWVTAVLVLGYAAWLLGSAWSGGAKLAAGGLSAVAGPADVELELDFAPEPFHIAVFQDAGRLIAVRGARVYLKDVPPDRLRELAARYWVRAVRPWADG